MNIDFVNVTAAAALIVPTAVATVLAVVGRVQRKRIKALEGCKANLSAMHSDAIRALIALRASTERLIEDQKRGHEHHIANLKGIHVEELEDQHQRNMEREQALFQEKVALESLLNDLQVNPLHQLEESELAAVIKAELTRRVLAKRTAEVIGGAYGAENHVAHRIATTVGGACFRVTDHCKRAHGAFADLPAYPKAD